MTLFRPAATVIVVMTVLFGFAYPLGMTALSGALFPREAKGSLIVRDGRIVGSALIGQMFEAPHYLMGRPSAVAYDAANSSGSNLGPTNARLIGAVRDRASAFVAAHGVKPPVDLVTASASGLDPHISPDAAFAQAARIAEARGVSPAQIRAFLRERVEGRALGLFGEPVVNVLLANLALDAAFPLPDEPAIGAQASDG
ncbi:potassium-transporting ATPase subunit KdpC [Acuticoccus sp. M5D2P5]|uniref:potassium-transporting ATPase subunit KdpC n=1 Tax=Acuticoccus kalidii TaxID=2910977 RepID=UPI001F2E9C1C|nr:potassium-transporting ATPase subunit KdpC [Acuticoccus kalidii]MCF3933712.1 potassium-transporting ATPase subunit KdpC [Acuticoccus kalidii]